MANGGSEKYLRGAEALLASPLVQNVTAEHSEFFNRKPSLPRVRKDSGPLRQKFTANEVALGIDSRNGAGLQAYVIPSASVALM
jgi:hypothetical protein